MSLTDRQKLGIAGGVAALATTLATVLLVRHFTPPSHTLERTPTPDLRTAVRDLIDEIRQLPPDARQARLLPPPHLEGVQPNVPALEVAFDALAEAEDIEGVRIHTLPDNVVEATLHYTEPNGDTARMTLLLYRADGQLVPLTLTP